MKRIAKLLCCLLAFGWIQTAAAVGPGSKTPDGAKNANTTVRVDRAEARKRLEKRGTRGKEMIKKADKPAEIKGND